MVEEQSGDEGIFADYEKVSAKEVNARINEIKSNAEFADELSILNDWTKKTKAIAALKKQIKEQNEALDKAVLESYPHLKETEIKEIVVHNKWLADLEMMIAEANQAVLLKLTSRLRELAERYETPLPQLRKQTENLSDKVEKHLKKMGFLWC